MGSVSPFYSIYHETLIIYHLNFEELCKSSHILVKESSTSLVRVKELHQTFSADFFSEHRKKAAIVSLIMAGQK